MTERKNILITGASSGLGSALAKYYAAKKARLFLGGRHAERLIQIAEICEELGAEVHIQVAATEATEIIHQWISSTDKRYPLDLVIANAGISGGTSGLSPEEFSAQSQHIFNVNVIGVLNTIHPILPRMCTRKSGHIAIISSLASFAGWPGAPAYSASKAAVRVYGEALRGRFEKDGVKVSVVCPGFVRTPMTDVNPYPMPFLMDSEQAAKTIARGLERNKALIAFPGPMAVISKLIGLLPLSFRLFVLKRAPEKTSLQNF